MSDKDTTTKSADKPVRKRRTAAAASAELPTDASRRVASKAVAGKRQASSSGVEKSGGEAVGPGPAAKAASGSVSTTESKVSDKARVKSGKSAVMSSGKSAAKSAKRSATRSATGSAEAADGKASSGNDADVAGKAAAKPRAPRKKAAAREVTSSPATDAKKAPTRGAVESQPPVSSSAGASELPPTAAKRTRNSAAKVGDAAVSGKDAVRPAGNTAKASGSRKRIPANQEDTVIGGSARSAESDSPVRHERAEKASADMPAGMLNDAAPARPRRRRRQVDAEVSASSDSRPGSGGVDKGTGHAPAEHATPSRGGDDVRPQTASASGEDAKETRGHGRNKAGRNKAGRNKEGRAEGGGRGRRRGRADGESANSAGNQKKRKQGNERGKRNKRGKRRDGDEGPQPGNRLPKSMQVRDLPDDIGNRLPQAMRRMAKLDNEAYDNIGNRALPSSGPQVVDDEIGNRGNCNVNNHFPSDSNILANADGSAAGGRGRGRARNSVIRGGLNHGQGKIGVWIGGTIEPGLMPTRRGKEANGNVAPRSRPVEEVEVNGNCWNRSSSGRRQGAPGEGGRGSNARGKGRRNQTGRVQGKRKPSPRGGRGNQVARGDEREQDRSQGRRTRRPDTVASAESAGGSNVVSAGATPAAGSETSTRRADQSPSQGQGQGRTGRGRGRRRRGQRRPQAAGENAAAQANGGQGQGGQAAPSDGAPPNRGDGAERKGRGRGRGRRRQGGGNTRNAGERSNRAAEGNAAGAATDGGKSGGKGTGDT